MSNAPVLASKVISVRQGRRETLRVKGGLDYIRGNASPYFSLTCDILVNGRDIGGGANHQLILAHFPKFGDLADLHLCDMDGTPMHAVANAYFWIAGANGGLLQEYHGANGAHAQTPDQCVDALARHLRISKVRAGVLSRVVANVFNQSYGSSKNSSRAKSVATARLSVFVERMRPVWKREAGRCIQNHGLVVYGDVWERKDG